MTAAQPEPERSGPADDPTTPDGGSGIAGRATGISGIVERQIRQAQERGAFDNLPGAGRPLRGLGGPHDENWWLRQYLLREGVSGEAFLPPALALRKEVENLADRVCELPTETQVRLVVQRLNERILDALRAPGDGPPVTVMAVDQEEIVLGWRFARIARRSAAVARAAGTAADPAGRTAAEPPDRAAGWTAGRTADRTAGQAPDAPADDPSTRRTGRRPWRRRRN